MTNYYLHKTERNFYEKIKTPNYFNHPSPRPFDLLLQ